MQRSTPFIIPLLSLCSITCVCQRQAKADEPPCPSQEQMASSPPKAGLRESALPIGGDINIEADRALGNIADWTLLLSGNVEVQQGVRDVKGEEIEYNRRTNSVKSDSRLEYSDPLVRLTGNEGGSYSPEEGGEFKAAEFELRQRSARGTAHSMRWTPQGVLRMQGVTFTTCPVSDESWRIKASRVQLDTQSKVGSAQGAVVDFMGVPILYLPVLSFPLSNERKSGFLFPVVGATSQSGAQLSVPYYFNIAPNVDLTFEPTIYQLRNEDLAGDFRYLTESSHGEVNWNFLPNDSRFASEAQTTDTQRSRVAFTNVTELPASMRLSLQAANVSDSRYFEDFSQGPEGAATAFLDRAALLSYRDENWRIDGEAEQYQTVDSTLPLPDRPYARVPRVAVDGDFGFGPGQLLHYGFDSEAVRFDRDITPLTTATSATSPYSCATILALGCRVTGWRFTVSPHASLNIDGPGYFVHPTVGYSATQYELSNLQPYMDLNANKTASPTRLLPLGSFDTGLVLEREMGAKAQHTLTLEPRLMYLWVPYRNQANLPLFDTGLPDLNPIQLFRTNRYVGGDRIGDANQLTAALTSRLLDSGSGQQFISATIGQAYYFVPPRVTIPLEEPLTQRSDLVAQLQLTAFEHWNADYGLQWDPRTSSPVRQYVNLQYRPKPTQVVNLSYRYELNSVDQVEVSTAWPITHKWNGFMREIYSLRSETFLLPTSTGGTQPQHIPAKPLETFAGFEYRACCWGVRIGARQFVSTFTGSQSVGGYLELELMGFASLGNDSDSVLMENIRGYVPPNARVPQNFVPPAFP